MKHSDEVIGLNVSAIPTALGQLRQWICWRLDPPRKPGGKPVKTPIDPATGRKAKVSEGATWGTIDQAIARMEADELPGIGFVFTDSDPYCGIDLDDCRDPESGAIQPWAQAIIDHLRSYTEVSPSGTGVHVIVKGQLPGPRCRTGHVEMYDQGRYFTITGESLPDSPNEILERQAELDQLYEQVFGEDEAQGGTPPQGSQSRPDLDDEELLELARRAKNGVAFSSLWGGQLNGHSSHSEADLALCGMLCFWTGGDGDHVDRLFRRSGLMREKWDELRGGLTYGQRTIRTALEGKTEFYRPGPNGGPKRNQRKKWPRTDTGNAERLVEKFGNRIRHCHPWRKDLVYRGGRWQIDQSGTVMSYTKTVAREILDEAKRIEDTDEREKYQKWSVRSESDHRRKAMIALARSETGIPILPEQLDLDPWSLNCRNGTIDLKSGELRPHRREDYITKIVPVPYDPDASCPDWESFLQRVVPDDENRRFLQRAGGYTLTGSVSEQCLFFLQGEGKNGKTTYLNATQRTLGKGYAIQAAPDLLLSKSQRDHPTELADLFGVRMAVCSEIGPNRSFDEVLVKRLTGGDPIRARRMREDFWEFDPSHKLWLGANHRPVVRGTDYAIWRRILLIPFTVTIPEEECDPELPEKLLRERPGILAWMVRGCGEYLERGLDPPEQVRCSTNEYRAEMDVIGRFLEDRTERVRGAEIGATALYRAYSGWCDQAGERPEKQTAFGRSMTERGFERRKSGGLQVYVDFRVMTDGDTHEGGFGQFGPKSRIDVSDTPREEVMPDLGPNPPNPPCDRDEGGASKGPTPPPSL